ncbi:MAG TPA: Uma2 family endonuclease, partial [Longimicrobiales bacterium]|nr:Uma2 family endonuclease [Longimicrobiales bacterium]
MASSSHFGGGTMTLLEYQNLEERGDERLELIHGHLVREPAPGGVHGVVLLDLLHALHEHVRTCGLGRVLVETGVRYPGEPGTVRRPDIAFITAAHLPPEPPLSFWEVVPDLVIEIVSPNDRWTLVQQKIEADLE